MPRTPPRRLPTSVAVSGTEVAAFGPEARTRRVAEYARYQRDCCCGAATAGVIVGLGAFVVRRITPFSALRKLTMRATGLLLLELLMAMLGGAIIRKAIG